MHVSELSREQLLELKQNYLDEHLIEVEGRTASMNELANADEIIGDDIIYDAYGNTDFVDDDFFCTANKDAG